MITRSNTYLTTPSGARIRVEKASVEMSEEWSPFVRAKVTLPAAISGAFTAYDPRAATPPAVRLDCFRHGGSDDNSLAAQTALVTSSGKVSCAALTTAGANKIARLSALAEPYESPRTFTQHLAARLVVDDARHDMKAGTYQLSLVSREVLLHDFEWTGIPQYITPGTLTWMLAQVLRIADQPTLILNPVAIRLKGFTWETGQSAWSVIEALTTPIGYRLVGDLTGTWRLVERTTQSAPRVLDPAALLGFSRALSRDNWYDYVHVDARFENYHGQDGTTHSTAGVFPGTKAQKLDMGLNSPGYNNDVAQTLLDRYSRRGDSYTIVSPLDLSYQPLDRLTILSNTYTVVSVTHDLTDHTTTLTTREG